MIVISKALPEKLTGMARPLIERTLQPYDRGATWQVSDANADTLLNSLEPVKGYLPMMGFTLPIPRATEGLDVITRWLCKAGLSAQVKPAA